MIARYNPETEFLIQYMSQAGTARTVTVLSDENKTPKQVWEEMKDSMPK